jgi:hypothetical protein
MRRELVENSRAANLSTPPENSTPAQFALAHGEQPAMARTLAPAAGRTIHKRVGDVNTLGRNFSGEFFRSHFFSLAHGTWLS